MPGVSELSGKLSKSYLRATGSKQECWGVHFNCAFSPDSHLAKSNFPLPTCGFPEELSMQLKAAYKSHSELKGGGFDG